MEEYDTHESHGDGYLDVLSDPGHFFAELTYEAVFFVLGALWVKWKLHRRDEQHSHVDCEHVGSL